MASRPNPGNAKYTIERADGLDIKGNKQIRYNVYKLDADDEHVNTYNIIVTIKDGQREYNCSCPAYKALCKHVHWAKKLWADEQKDPAIIGVMHYPKDGTWVLRRKATQ